MTRGQATLKTAADRLRWAREHYNRGGEQLKSPRAAAQRFGWNENTYKSHEQGIRRAGGLPEDVAKKYARMLGVSYVWLMTGAGEPEDVGQSGLTSIPVISWVSAGRLTELDFDIPTETETIEITGLEPGDYFATRVKGDSMDRISPDGSLILVNRAERQPLRGRRYIFSNRGRTTFKRLELDPWRLEPESTNPTNKPIFPKTEEEWSIIGRVRLTLLDDL